MPLTKLKGWSIQVILLILPYTNHVLGLLSRTLMVMGVQGQHTGTEHKKRLTQRNVLRRKPHKIHETLKRIQAKSKLKPSLIYRFRRLLTIPLIGLVILMLEIELAMAGRCSTRRGSSSAAAGPLPGPPAPSPAPDRFSGAFRSRRRQLTQIPIK